MLQNVGRTPNGQGEVLCVSTAFQLQTRGPLCQKEESENEAGLMSFNEI